MYFPGLKLTDAGKAMIVKALDGGTIKFTGMKLGAGPEPEYPEKMDALGDERASAQLESIERGEGCVELVANFDNSGLQEGFEARELGIMAEDPDDGEVLYAYANAGEKATFIPSFETNSFIRTLFRVEVAVGDAENVTAVVGEYLGWASKEEFEGHVADRNNPHNVTKKQLGLENVQNVSPSNMQVAFNERIEGNEEIANIKTNEKLTDVFRKILLVFDSFFKHLKATNPHNVTASQVGIAQSNLISTYTHAYDASTKTHKFTGSGNNGIAKITADFTAGDKFAVNGVKVSAYCGKDSPDGNTIVKGRWVSFIFDGSQLNFKGGGGLGNSDLGEATAGTGDVVKGKTYFSKNKTMKTGTMPNLTQESQIEYSAGNDTKVIEGDETYCNTNTDGTKRVCVRYKGERGCIENNTLFGRPAEDFGTAQKAQILSGYTATCQDGLRVDGEIPNYGYEPTAKGCALYNGDVYLYLQNANTDEQGKGGFLIRGIHAPKDKILNSLGGEIHNTGWGFHTKDVGSSLSNANYTVGAPDGNGTYFWVAVCRTWYGNENSPVEFHFFDKNYERKAGNEQEFRFAGINQFNTSTYFNAVQYGGFIYFTYIRLY